MSEIKNRKNTDFSNVFTFKFQHLFQGAVPANVKITTELFKLSGVSEHKSTPRMHNVLKLYSCGIKKTGFVIAVIE